MAVTRALALKKLGPSPGTVPVTVWQWGRGRTRLVGPGRLPLSAWVGAWAHLGLGLRLSHSDTGVSRTVTESGYAALG